MPFTCSTKRIVPELFATDTNDLRCKDCKAAAPPPTDLYALLEEEFWWAGIFFCPRCSKPWAACRICKFRVQVCPGGRDLRRHASRSKTHQDLVSSHLQSRERAETSRSDDNSIFVAMDTAGANGTNVPYGGAGDVSVELTIDLEEQYLEDNKSFPPPHESSTQDSEEDNTKPPTDDSQDGWFGNLKQQCVAPNNLLDSFPNQREYKYFEAEFNGASGASRLVAGAMHDSDTYASKIHPLDALWSLVFAWLATDMSERQ
jgi:hypothetical protein